MSIKNTLKTLLLAGVIGYTSAAFAGGSIAIVNLTQVFQAVPDGQPAFSQLQKKFQPQAALLQQRQDALNKQIQAFQASQDSLSPQQKNDQTQALLAQQKKLQQNIDAYQNNLKQQQQTLLTAFGNQMKTVVTQIAKSSGYHLILSSQTALYSDSSVDITPQVIASMKTKS